MSTRKQQAEQLKERNRYLKRKIKNLEHEMEIKMTKKEVADLAMFIAGFRGISFDRAIKEAESIKQAVENYINSESAVVKKQHSDGEQN